jgi:RNA polymerase sigma factor (TIGR02999 family)
MSDITVLLIRLREGDSEAFDELVPLVYQELRDRATRYLSGQRDRHTLQPTALVHEVFLKMVGRDVSWENARHFYNAAAEVMRQILISHARAKSRLKRGGDAVRLEIDTIDTAVEQEPDTWLALDEALAELRRMDSRRYQVVMLKYFAGLTDAQVAAALSISEKTAERDWATARVFLRAQMDGA